MKDNDARIVINQHSDTLDDVNEVLENHYEVLEALRVLALAQDNVNDAHFTAMKAILDLLNEQELHIETLEGMLDGPHGSWRHIARPQV